MTAHVNRSLAVFALALIADFALGEPPHALHPVAWLGTASSLLSRRLASEPLLRRPRRELMAGATIATLMISAAVLTSRTLMRLTRRLPSPLALAIEAYLLKTCFSGRMLFQAVATVQASLQRNDLEAARTAASQLVSRQVHYLPPPLIAAAAIETLSENLSDSLIAPLLGYIYFGLPGAAAYRAINTLDAMFGYRDEREFLGKAPARLDDVANWLPARLTALCISLAGLPFGISPWRIWQEARREHRKTLSPNAGWPMAAMASLLRVCLEKHGTYRICPQYREPSALDLRTSLRFAALASALGCLTIASILYHRTRRTFSA